MSPCLYPRLDSFALYNIDAALYCVSMRIVVHVLLDSARMQCTADGGIKSNIEIDALYYVIPRFLGLL